MAYTNIDRPLDNFVVTTWSGNNVDGRTISNGEFKPDFLWMFHRNIAGSCPGVVYNSTIGAGTDSTAYGGNSTGKYNAVFTSLNYNLAGGDFYRYGYLSGLTSTGFTCAAGNDPSGYQNYRHNQTGYNYVAWQWKANGGTTSSNTDGTGITSTVQANTDAGFSIVTYTGIGSGNANPSVGHGLGVTPQVVLVKGLSQANSWIMYHYGIDGANSRNKYLLLDTNGAAGTLANYWGTSTSGGVTSSTFGVYADNQSGNNYLNGKHVAYCFAEKQGFSKFGSYIGNGNANGTFVYTGFKPAWVMTKEVNAAGSWVIYDNKRDTFNPETKLLSAEASSAESTFTQYDFVSNGFKFRTSGSENSSGNKHIYMAFAEHPFTTSTGIPTTAR